MRRGRARDSSWAMAAFSPMSRRGVRRCRERRGTIGPENGFDPNGYTVYLADTPIARGEIKLKEITIPVEMFEPVRGLVCQCEDACQWMGFTLKIEVPKRWRCRSRKRFIKLMMSEGISRNYAERLADIVRGWMPYGKAWREYLWKKL